MCFHKESILGKEMFSFYLCLYFLSVFVNFVFKIFNFNFWLKQENIRIIQILILKSKENFREN